MYKVNAIRILQDTKLTGRGNTLREPKGKFEIDLDGKKMAFLGFGGFGDCAMITPTIAEVRKNCKGNNSEIFFKKHPVIKNLAETDSELKATIENFTSKTIIDFGVPDMYRDCFNENPHIDNIFDVRKINDWEFRRYYDYIFNYDNVITGNQDAEKMHGIDACFRWLDADFNFSKLTDEDRKMYVNTTPSSISKVNTFFKQQGIEKDVKIGLQLRSSSFVRSWLPEYNKQLAKSLGDLGYKVILFAADTTWKFTGKNIVWVRPQLSSMADMVALCRELDLMIAPDSSFIHIAQALNIPLIGLYSAFPSEYRMLFSETCQAIESNGACKHKPCFYHRAECNMGVPAPCMEAITPEIVLNKAKEILSLTLKDKTTKIIAPSVQELCSFCDGSHIFQLYKDKNKAETIVEGYSTCSFCSSIFRVGEVSNKEFTDDYSKVEYHENYFSDNYVKDSLKIAESIHNHINLRIREEKLLSGKLFTADLGCGVGMVSYYLKTFDDLYIINPIDISVNASRLAKEKLDINIKNYDCINDNIYAANYFHVIILTHFLEHLSVDEMKLLINKIKFALHVDGFLYIYGPDADRFFEFYKHAKSFDEPWIHLNTRNKFEHINIPSKKGLETFLEDNGFQVLRVGKVKGFSDDFEIIARLKE